MRPDEYWSPLLPRVACAAAWAWLALVLAAPFGAGGAPLSAAAYALGSLVCHQQSARSFHLAGAQLPVCARCAGLYVGAALGAVVPLVLRTFRQDPGLSRMRMLLVVSAVPTLATWGAEAARLAEPSNLTRALAAVPLGLIVAATIVATADGRLR